jgi:hypothetical protein
MSEMIEKVARAIDPEGWAYHEVYLKIKEADAEMAKEFRDRSVRIQRSLERARAAMEAMRDGYPPEHMIIAGHEALLNWDARTGDDLGIADMFRAMLDAALHSNPSADSEATK